jgi:hypothetical protein
MNAEYLHVLSVLGVLLNEVVLDELCFFVLFARLFLLHTYLLQQLFLLFYCGVGILHVGFIPLIQNVARFGCHRLEIRHVFLDSLELDWMLVCSDSQRAYTTDSLYSWSSTFSLVYGSVRRVAPAHSLHYIYRVWVPDVALVPTV